MNKMSVSNKMTLSALALSPQLPVTLSWRLVAAILGLSVFTVVTSQQWRRVLETLADHLADKENKVIHRNLKIQAVEAAVVTVIAVLVCYLILLWAVHRNTLSHGQPVTRTSIVELKEP
jgi:hypothetical protein